MTMFKGDVAQAILQCKNVLKHDCHCMDHLLLSRLWEGVDILADMVTAPATSSTQFLHKCLHYHMQEAFGNYAKEKQGILRKLEDGTTCRLALIAESLVSLILKGPDDGWPEDAEQPTRQVIDDRHPSACPDRAILDLRESCQPGGFTRVPSVTTPWASPRLGLLKASRL